MDKHVIEECNRLAFEGRISFPESVRRMREEGVEHYFTDLALMQKTHYDIGGEIQVVPLPLDPSATISDVFSEEEVKDALAAIRSGAIAYPEFLRRIMAAGTAYYAVFLGGRKAVYTGRHGDFYVEPFPGSL